MKKETWILVGGALIIGILVGILLSKGGKPSPATVAQSSPQAAPVVDYQRDIAMLEQVVAREPENRNAWIQLGNLYFDSDQPIKSVESYDKALAIDNRDPNVLTDQGVMFRRLGWFDKAVENFTKAVAIQPNHLQAYYNLGIVYRYDLQNFDAAKTAWEKYLSMNPTGPGADQVREQMQFLTTHPPVSQNK
ncbi:MAG: tetratricopeptide repeat protein [Desulfuromonadales bacterium]|nr:tetratricopeptide repeat protein [Desulfuromonadales bacterium]MDT8422364.1 tetratricopeptide repeat protein [Desulfuromonadales bacterium]